MYGKCRKWMGHPNGFLGGKSLGILKPLLLGWWPYGNNGTFDPRIDSQTLLLDSTFTSSGWIARNPMTNHCYPSFLAKSFRSGNKTSNVRNIPAMGRLFSADSKTISGSFPVIPKVHPKKTFTFPPFLPSTTCRRPNEFKPNFPRRKPALHTLDRRPWWCTRNFWSQWLRPDNGNHPWRAPHKISDQTNESLAQLYKLIFN